MYGLLVSAFTGAFPLLILQPRFIPFAALVAYALRQTQPVHGRGHVVSQPMYSSANWGWLVVMFWFMLSVLDLISLFLSEDFIQLNYTLAVSSRVSLFFRELCLRRFSFRVWKLTLFRILLWNLSLFVVVRKTLRFLRACLIMMRGLGFQFGIRERVLSYPRWT